MEHFFEKSPSNQNPIDLFAGHWSSVMPDELAVDSGGRADLHHDGRIAWALEILGGAAGADVLELGPLEAAHTAMLEKAGAASIVSIEGNSEAYLRCLIVKELLGLSRSRFLLGNFVGYLQENEIEFDLGIACGVLYHMKNPVELIQLLARRTRRLFVWTHYYDEALISRDERTRKYFAGAWQADFEGFQHTLHAHGYAEAKDFKGFCGGGAEGSNWMEKDEMLAAFSRFGMELVGEKGEPEHPHGPATWLAFKRR